jgi:uncharacterized repeat protein (TIGR03837 family)
MNRTWDIFCSVVDNFGDIGVCWRLARQLSLELQQSVRLWVDDLSAFHRINHAVDPASAAQTVSDVDIRRWQEINPDVEPAQIVVEGFGAKLPERYITAMAEHAPAPIWINLEYLSAEQWVEGCHSMPSPHPNLPLIKYFFFPGFTPGTGGLLMETGIADRRDGFQGDRAAVDAFWQELAIASPRDGELRCSLFCYENAALPVLVDAWAAGLIATVCVVPCGKALEQLAALTGEDLVPGSRMVRGQLTIHALPFLDMDRYDRLLWACDINFVRGEDSFVRAQIAGGPLIWQAYPQGGDAHLVKASAFIERYVSGADTATALAIRTLNMNWNEQSAATGDAWATFIARRTTVAAHARAWAARITAGGSLAHNLAGFCEDRLK